MNFEECAKHELIVRASTTLFINQKISSKHKRSDSDLQEEPFKRCIFPKILSTGFHKSERQA